MSDVRDWKIGLFTDSVRNGDMNLKPELLAIAYKNDVIYFVRVM